jgi:hypothetical protein
MLASCLALSSALKTKAACSSETSIEFQKATRRKSLGAYKGAWECPNMLIIWITCENNIILWLGGWRRNITLQILYVWTLPTVLFLSKTQSCLYLKT